jgi:integrase
MASKKILSNGTRIQYTITRKILPGKKLYYSCTKAEEPDFDAMIAKLEAMLDAGVIPPEIQAKFDGKRHEPGGSDTFAWLLRSYREAAEVQHIKKDDLSRLEKIAEEFGGTKLAVMNTSEWSSNFVSELKRKKNLSEATVVHYIGALRRCLDFAVRNGKLSSVSLRFERRGFGTYTPADIDWLLGNGKEVKESRPRNRRPSVKEWTEILRVASGEKPENRQRSLELEFQAAFECILKIAPETAMRLSEIHTLRLSQVNFQEKIIHLSRTKNGSERFVPMNSLVISLLVEYLEHVKNGTRGMAGFSHENDLLFPFYPGDVDSREQTQSRREATTNRLSHRYAALFDAAGCGDLRFHDLRHEAVSRLFERTTLGETAIQKITGHLSKEALARYLNLRPKFLVEQIEGAAGMK